MKENNYTVRVPEPCHEDWNKMLPEEKGRFCNSCSKTVVDFSNKTDYEIKNYLNENSGTKVCGHFKESQLNRPLNYSLNFADLPKNISTTKAFVIALFLVFGSILFSCTNEKDQNVEVVGDIAMPQEMVTMGAPMLNYEIVDSLTEVNTVEGEIVCRTESFVNGGVGYEIQDAIQDTIYQVKDSLIPTVTTETIYRTMGIIAVEVVQADTTSTDSLSKENKALQISDNVISKTTDLSVYPNPTTGDFTIKYDVTKRADIRIDIYDIKGAHIKSIVNQPSQHAGKYQIPVSLNEMPAGIYIVNLINGEKRFSEKIVLNK